MAFGTSLHIDIAEVQTTEGKLYLFVGIDRTSKFAVTQLVDKADRKTAWEFLQHMLEAVPYQVHTILTDNGIQFAEQPRNRNTNALRHDLRGKRACGRGRSCAAPSARHLPALVPHHARHAGSGDVAAQRDVWQRKGQVDETRTRAGCRVRHE